MGLVLECVIFEGQIRCAFTVNRYRNHGSFTTNESELRTITYDSLSGSQSLLKFLPRELDNVVNRPFQNYPIAWLHENLSRTPRHQ